MLKVENLQYGYPGGPEVLKDISFTLGEGQFMAILGNNGAGKSTMLGRQRQRHPCQIWPTHRPARPKPRPQECAS